jgi:hypothetical protein
MIGVFEVLTAMIVISNLLSVVRYKLNAVSQESTASIFRRRTIREANLVLVPYRLFIWLKIRPWEWCHCFHPNCWWISTGPHGVTSQTCGTHESSKMCVQIYNILVVKYGRSGLNAEFEVITSVKIMTWLFCVVKPCSLVDGYQHFGGL